MRSRAVYLVLLLSSLVCLPAIAQFGDSTLGELMSGYYEAMTPAELDDAISRLVESGAEAAVIAQQLRVGKTYTYAVRLGWSVNTVDGLDGRTRPYHVFVPTDYDPDRSYPVLFDLHGSVTGPARDAEYLFERRQLWQSEAETEGWILVAPHGDRNASWFSADGRYNLLEALAFVKRQYNVNENKVFISGFSDGGSGAFWMGFHDPTPWAAMIAYHGHPGIGGYGPYQSYPRNLTNRPIRATTGEEDDLFPPSDISPYVELFEGIGVEIDWLVYPGGHEAQFLLVESDLTIDFVDRTTRDPFPSIVVWETSHTDIGRCDWLRIDEIGGAVESNLFADVNLEDIPEQVVFGASVAYHGGTLFTVAGLEPGSAAHLMGITNGDQLIRIDETPVFTQADIGTAMVGKQPGDPVEVEYIRGGETFVIQGRIPEPDLIYRREADTGSIRATANGNEIQISLSRVARFTLLISSQQFDLTEPITVIVNGDTVFSDKVVPDVRFMLEQAASDLDRTMVYEAKIEISMAATE